MRLATSIKSIPAEDWKGLESTSFPFTDYAFIKALEDTGCIGETSGWQPIYLEAHDTKGLAGLALGYMKSHSYGEYIFDWDWARFYQNNQHPYYPKLLLAVPFTPATGPRLMIRSDADAPAIRAELIRGLIQITEKSELSSAHALFITAAECLAFKAQDFTIRHSMQYHWQNHGYRDFQDYLDSFIGKRRRDIQRERQRAQNSGLTIQSLSGHQLTPKHAAAMDRLYLSTAEKKNAIPYLKPGFFAEVFANMPNQILLVLALDGEDLIAGSLNFYKGDCLYGRYWGCLAQIPDLHFELCYYQTIDFAIKRGLRLFEAGAQGEHKVQRGFLPQLTFSAHLIRQNIFRQPIESYIQEEKLALAAAFSALKDKNPFKQAGG